nr:hypothetical protein [Lachnospiraceae bacterium]
VLPTMIVHSVYDIAQSLNIGNANGFDVWKYVDLGMAAILAAVMMVILYKKRTETAALWARKWNNS